MTTFKQNTCYDNVNCTAISQDIWFQMEGHGPHMDASADSVLAVEGWLSCPEEQTCGFAAVFISIQPWCALVTTKLTSSFQAKSYFQCQNCISKPYRRKGRFTVYQNIQAATSWSNSCLFSTKLEISYKCYQNLNTYIHIQSLPKANFCCYFKYLHLLPLYSHIPLYFSRLLNTFPTHAKQCQHNNHLHFKTLWLTYHNV